MSQQAPESDHALAARAAQGDGVAFVALYDRLFEPVYDFLVRLLLSRKKAATAALATFLRLRRRLSEGRSRGKPRLLALAAAYQAALEAGAEQAPAAPDDEAGEEPAAFAQVDPTKLASPQEAARAQEEAPAVWEAAASLDRAEYALLDLHLRQGLNATEVGRVAGKGRIEAWSVVSRLKKAGDEALTSLLMLRLGRQRCRELQKLTATMGKAILPPDSRRTISDHALICPTCLETRTRLVPPLRVLAALRPVPPAPGVKDAVLQDLLAYTAAQAGAVAAAAPPAAAAPAAAAPRTTPARPRSMGPPPQRPRGPVAAGGPTGGPAFAVLMGAAAVLVLPVAALAVWLTVLAGDGGDGSASAGPTPTPLAEQPCASDGLETPGVVTCAPTPTDTPAPTSTPAPAVATSTPAPTDTATATPTAEPVATATDTPVVEETPEGIVETATPEPSPGAGATATAEPSPPAAESSTPTAQ